VNLIRTTIVALNLLRVTGTTVEDVLVREGHEHCPSHLNDDQSNYCDLLSDIHAHQFSSTTG
jgi:hypothetical protein